MKSEYTTECWGDTYKIRADFSNAASNIEVYDAYGEWLPTQWQVADVRHCPEWAMENVLEQDVIDSGSDMDDCRDDISAAIKTIELS